MSTEPWLREPQADLIAELQPVASMYIAAVEELNAVTKGLTHEQVWTSVGGAASIGFHLLHLAGATDRLLTYANAKPLTEQQFADLAMERNTTEHQWPLEELLARLNVVFVNAMNQLKTISAEQLSEPRTLGRARIPTTMRALVFHSGEHAARHTGQVTTTARIVRQMT